MMYSNPSDNTTLGRRYLNTVPATWKFWGLSNTVFPLKKKYPASSDRAGKKGKRQVGGLKSPFQMSELQCVHVCLCKSRPMVLSMCQNGTVFSYMLSPSQGAKPTAGRSTEQRLCWCNHNKQHHTGTQYHSDCLHSHVGRGSLRAWGDGTCLLVVEELSSETHVSKSWRGSLTTYISHLPSKWQLCSTERRSRDNLALFYYQALKDSSHISVDLNLAEHRAVKYNS